MCASKLRAYIVAGMVGVGVTQTIPAQSPAGPQNNRAGNQEKLPPPRSTSDTEPSPGGTILRDGELPIDLGTALRLAGVENPELLLARERVTEATALRQLAAAQILPNLNVGSNYDSHSGVLQRSNGSILKVQRDSLYVGLGAAAVGSGTVNIPGLSYNMNVGVSWYTFLAARQRIITTEATSDAVRNDVLLRVCLAYTDLLRAEGRRAIATKNRAEATELVRIAEVSAKVGLERKAEYDRATVELRRRDAELIQTEADILTASARLCQLLNLDPFRRLKPIDGWVVPAPLVPDPVPLPDLLAIALMQRPELAARRSEVRELLYALSLAKVLPFSPNAIVGYSAGGFGGGSDLVSTPPGVVTGNGQLVTGPRFSSLDSRSDFDVVLFWTFRNMGVGNVALVRSAESRVKQTRLREIETLNLVRSQVAESHARVAARFLQIDSAEKAVRASSDAYEEDVIRTKGAQGLPLEVVDSLRLLGRSRYDYLDAIIDYNRAQFQLWVALGRPPANALARPIPAALVPPPAAGVLPGPRVVPMSRVFPASLPVKS